jgi:L-fucose isomerase-like protein
VNFKDIRLGVVVVAETYADGKYLLEIKQELDKLLKNFEVDIFYYKEVINCRTESKKSGRYFKENGVDAIFVYLATYVQDNLVVDIVYPSNCEVIIWAPEEHLNYPVPDIAAYCGLIQVAGLLKKFNKKIVLVDGDFNNASNTNIFRRFLKVIATKKRLMYSKLGIIGSRSDGMLENVFNEVELRKQVGPEVIHISLSEFFEDLDLMKSKEVELSIKSFFTDEEISKLDKNILNESVKIYLVLKNIISKYNLSGITIKCWPELKNNNICSPCFALSKLYDEGITSACEADVTALVTMVIGDNLSDKPTFLADLLKIESQKKYAYYYHCGCASKKLCNNMCKIQYLENPFKEVFNPGVILQFPLKEGRVTFARLGERSGKFQIFSYTGASIKTDLFVAGNVLLAVLDKDPNVIINNLVEHGIEHHQIVFFGDYMNDLKMLCEFLEIDFI